MSRTSSDIEIFSNEYKYNFKDFTHFHYEEIIDLAKSKGEFVKYTDVSNSKNKIFWRHDIDMSLDLSLELAKIEAELGVTSTYFILLHSEFYSPLEKKSAKIIREIINMGHSIGLHFDSHFYDISEEEQLEKHILFEKKIIDNLFEINVEVFSFHSTTEFTMSCKKSHYAGMVNVYSNKFQEDVQYCSDSNGYWRHKRLYDFLSELKNFPIQVLTHPEWWTPNIMSPRQKIDSIIQSRAAKVWSSYEMGLKKYGRENIDW